MKVLSSTVLARGAIADATVQSLFGPSAGVSAQVLSIESSDKLVRGGKLVGLQRQSTLSEEVGVSFRGRRLLGSRGQDLCHQGGFWVVPSKHVLGRAVTEGSGLCRQGRYYQGRIGFCTTVSQSHS